MCISSLSLWGSLCKVCALTSNLSYRDGFVLLLPPDWQHLERRQPQLLWNTENTIGIIKGDQKLEFISV